MTSTSLPDSLIATLPGVAYTDPGLFAQEQERIFEAMWFCAVRASDLPTPGAFRTVEVGRESILITRARETARCAPTSTSAGTAARNCAPRSRGR
ncbi:phenylpropionate dioxygenase-like ring-hydroxylating dioxygenase large terminal subunit [Streptomyces canus]